MGSRLSCVAREMERLSLDLTQAAKNKGIWDCLEFAYGLRVTSAKSRNVKGASHQPASMGSCLTIRGVCENSVRFSLNDDLMETVEYMWVDIWRMLDRIIGFCHKTAETHFLGISCSTFTLFTFHLEN